MDQHRRARIEQFGLALGLALAAAVGGAFVVQAFRHPAPAEQIARTILKGSDFSGEE